MNEIIWDSSNYHIKDAIANQSPGRSPVLRRLNSHLGKDSREYEFKLLKRVGTVFEGSGFGEIALMSKKPAPRTATIQCDKDCVVAILTKDVFNKCIKEAMQRKVD